METILSYLRDRFGYNVSDQSFYRHIAEWERWYMGYGTEFHRTRVNNGISVIEHDLSKMNMAKKVAEDWANLLMNEQTRLDAQDPVASKFLRGKEGNGGVLGENDFWTQMNRLLEKTFALGK